MATRSTSRAPCGLTVVELMVTIAIISVLSARVMGVNGRAYGATASSVSDQLPSALGVAKLRAISTRRYTRLEIKKQTATLWQSSQTGMLAPTTWLFCQNFTVP